MFLTYKHTTWLYRIIALLLIPLLFLATYKTYRGILKIELYQQAEKNRQSDRLISAEEQFRAASEITALRYKDDETQVALDALKPITGIKAMLNSIKTEADEASDKEDVTMLLSIYQDYVKKTAEYAEKDNFTKKIYSEATKYYSLDTVFKDALEDFRKKDMKSLQNAINKKTFSEENSLSNLLQIHNIYDHHDAKLIGDGSTLVEEFGKGKLDSIFKDKGLDESLKGASSLLTLFKSNGVKSEWLTVKVDEFVKAGLKQASDQADLTDFAAKVKVFQSSKEWASSPSTVPDYIKSIVQSLLTKAAQLNDSGKHDDSIALYRQLAAVTDTSGQIQNIEFKILESDPGKLLKKAAPDRNFNVIGTFKGGGDALASVIGTDGDQIGLARLMTNGNVSYSAGTLGGGIQVKSARLAPELSAQGQQALLIEAAPRTRQHHYIAYAIAEDGLRKTLNVDADRINVEGSGVLLIDNIPGDGENQQSYYEYKGGKYTFTKIKPDYIEIALDDLSNYRNVKVRFSCKILTADGNNAVVALNDQYVLLTSTSTSLKPGNAVVTGKWTSTSEIKKGALSITAYNFQVTAIN